MRIEQTSRKIRRQKRARLIGLGFNRDDARRMAALLYSTRPYIKLMLRHRKRLIRGAKTPAEARRLIKAEIEQRGWRDIFSMMRDYRQAARDRGWESPPGKKSKDYHRSHKGDVKAQKARYRERLANKQTGRGAIYPKTDGSGYVRFNYDTGRFEDV